MTQFWPTSTASGGGSSETVTLTRVASQTMSGHRAVTPLPDGTVVYADPATIGNQPVWISLQAVVAGSNVDVVAFGDVIEGSWAWAPGNIYLAANGVLTQTQPTSGALVIVGAATAPIVLFVDRVPTIDL